MTLCEREYSLKIYDEVLLSFFVKVDEFGRMSAFIDSFDESKRHRLPFQLFPEPTGDRILAWLVNRTIPKNRRFVEQILAAAGLKQGDTLDEALALVAYTGYTSSQRHKIGLSTEWTTDGQFAKAWRRIDGKLYLFKAGSEGFANAGMEPYSEYFAAQAAEAMGIAHVPYDLRMWKGKLASVCPLLNSREVSFVPFWVAFGQSWFPDTLATAYTFSQKAYQQIRSMLVIDALICNPDRHAANYGMLRDNHTGKATGFAPLFDHNLSLFAREMKTDFPRFPEMANDVFAPAGSRLPFKDTAAAVMGDVQHEQLRRMIGFEFENHPRYPVPQERLDALNRYITIRTRELLEISPVKESELARSMEHEYVALKEKLPMLF